MYSERYKKSWTYLFDEEAGATSEPCCIREATVNQKLLARLNIFSTSSGSSMQGYGLSHSYGVKRASTKKASDTTTKPTIHKNRYSNQNRNI